MKKTIINNVFKTAVSIVFIFSVLVTLFLKGIEHESINERIYGSNNYDEKNYSDEYKEIEEGKRVLNQFSKYEEFENCSYVFMIGSYVDYQNLERKPSLFFKLSCDGYKEFQVYKELKDDEIKNINEDIKIYYFYKYDKQLINKSTLNNYSKKELEDTLKRENINELLNGINKKLKEHNEMKRKRESNVDSWE